MTESYSEEMVEWMLDEERIEAHLAHDEETRRESYQNIQEQIYRDGVVKGVRIA